MINSIKIKNFRSIQFCDVELSPLTVIVGANSTGKSNLIKALDFISDMTDFGLIDAIYNRGGFNEILPKQYKDLKGREISFELDFKIDSPEKWFEEYGDLTVDYKVSIKKLADNSIKISKESMTINSIFLLSDHNSKLRKGTEPLEKLDNLTLDEYKKSSITFYRNASGNFLYKTNFKKTNNNMKLFFNWLGLSSIISEELDQKRINSLINTILNNVTRNNFKNTQNLLLAPERLVTTFSDPLRKIVSELKAIAHYDLFINELRQEQSISNLKRVSTSGDNIPTIVKKFIKDNRDDWSRIIDTMCNISPYFTKAYSESLRAGKEYLVFEEIFDGRPIESWEASDGTLRALAILLCLESHEKGSTILIEEPEHGLHPWAVKDLMQHIRAVVENKNIQVILTTHSQQVLECLKPDELLITERDEAGTHYNKIKNYFDPENISMGEIGSLWTKGLLNGVPKAI